MTHGQKWENISLKEVYSNSALYIIWHLICRVRLVSYHLVECIRVIHV